MAHNCTSSVFQHGARKKYEQIGAAIQRYGDEEELHDAHSIGVSRHYIDIESLNDKVPAKTPLQNRGVCCRDKLSSPFVFEEIMDRFRDRCPNSDDCRTRFHTPSASAYSVFSLLCERVIFSHLRSVLEVAHHSDCAAGFPLDCKRPSDMSAVDEVVKAAGSQKLGSTIELVDVPARQVRRLLVYLGQGLLVLLYCRRLLLDR